MHIVMELLAELLAVHGYSCSWWLQLNGANRETGRETGVREGRDGGGRGGRRWRERGEMVEGEGGDGGGRGGRGGRERGETGAEFQLNKKSAQAVSHEQCPNTHRPVQR